MRRFMRAEQFIPYLARDGEKQLLVAVETLGRLGSALTKRLRGDGDFEEIREEMAKAAFCLRELQEIFGIGNLEIEERIQRGIDGYFSTGSEESHEIP